jgi:Nucleotide-diphospho-sugar transferase
VYDYATTSREDFLEKFDLGVPKDATTEGAEDVLILYNSNRSLPNTLKLEGGKAIQNHNHYLESAVEATEHCQSVKVVLVDPIQRSRKDVAQCLALVPQWSSPYIYKFMRLPDDQGDWHGKGRLDNNLPLRYVSRTHKSSGRHHATVPNLERHTLPSLRALSDYTQELPHAQQRLRSLLNNTDIHDPMIVMTVNKGQSELLVNFVCSATSRDLPLHRVILFATDQYTYSLCQDLRLQYCYHDPTLFGDIPQEAAEYFGDNTFMKVMKAKVYSVHLILTLGYSVLFMDVDVVWYKNPLDYYRTIMVNDQWDLVFQNDGAKTLQYAPYSPNSGFYFVRHSPKTMFLFGELLKMGDTISLYHSHQHALSQLLNEHISWTGLRVKVHNTGFDNPFPGGFEFSRRHLYMKELLGGAHTNQDPYIFHMCWTESKEYKIKFFQQMGLWYVIDGYKNGSCTGIGCCTKKPEVRCHFRDMPSKIPCNDSPPLDEEDPGKSFW